MQALFIGAKKCALYLTAPVWLPFLIVACATEIIFLPKEWRLRRKMQDGNRWMSISEFKKKDLIGGTIILEIPTFGYSFRRVWWTQDDVLAVAPISPPGYTGLPPTYDGAEPEVFRWHPFDRWLTESYLRPKDGGATLLRVWHRRVTKTQMMHRFPKNRVVECFSGGEGMEAFMNGPVKNDDIDAVRTDRDSLGETEDDEIR